MGEIIETMDKIGWIMICIGTVIGFFATIFMMFLYGFGEELEKKKDGEK